MKRVIAALLGGIFTIFPLSAQHRYTLDECVKEAINNNRALRNANNRIKIADEQKKEALTNYFPTISAAGGGFIADKGLIEMNMGGQTMSMAKDGIVASVLAMQPIFAGGQIVNGNKLAKVGKESSRLQLQLTENEIRLNTENYFWQIVMLKQKLHTLDLVEAYVERARVDAQAAIDAGIRNRNDLLQVQLRKNEMRTAHIQVENTLALCHELLAQYMGHANDSIQIAYSFTEDNYPMPDNPRSLFTPAEQALLQTSEYQLLEKQVDAENLQYKLAIGKQLPTVAIGGAYVFNNVLDKSQNNVMGMVTVSVPISSWWGGSHAIKRSKLSVQNVENDRQNQSEQLIIRMHKAWNDLNDAYKQIAIAKESIEQSEENLRLNSDYYQVGTATISDLLDAQTLYQQSCDKYVEAFTHFELKKCEYLQATGR